MANIKFSKVHKSFGKNKIISDFNLEGKDDDQQKEDVGVLPAIHKGDELTFSNIVANQRFSSKRQHC